MLASWVFDSPRRFCAAGRLSEEGLLLYLQALQSLLPLLPVSETNVRQEVTSDSEDEDDVGVTGPTAEVSHVCGDELTGREGKSARNTANLLET